MRLLIIISFKFELFILITQFLYFIFKKYDIIYFIKIMYK